MGMLEPFTVYTDSKAAYDICHRLCAAGSTKHINRRAYKMRELRGAGKIVLKLIATADNIADLFTKVWLRQPFEKLRAKVCTHS